MGEYRTQKYKNAELSLSRWMYPAGTWRPSRHKISMNRKNRKHMDKKFHGVGRELQQD